METVKSLKSNARRRGGAVGTQRARERDAGHSEGASATSPRTSHDGATPGEGSSRRSSNVAIAGARINGVVQWSRNRFNECLEKSALNHYMISGIQAIRKGHGRERKVIKKGYCSESRELGALFKIPSTNRLAFARNIV